MHNSWYTNLQLKWSPRSDARRRSLVPETSVLTRLHYGEENGRARRNRIVNLLHPMQAEYQVILWPDGSRTWCRPKTCRFKGDCADAATLYGNKMVRDRRIALLSDLDVDQVSSLDESSRAARVGIEPTNEPCLTDRRRSPICLPCNKLVEDEGYAPPSVGCKPTVLNYSTSPR